MIIQPLGFLDAGVQVSMGIAAETRSLVQLAIPLTLIQLTEGLVHFVDALMMGWLGTAELAAGGLGAIIFWTLLAFFTGLLEMTGALAAEAYGAGDRARISRITAQALWLSVGMAIPAMIVLWNLAGMLQLMGQAASTIDQTMAYLRAILWGLPAALGLFVFKEITTALMNPRLLTLLMVLGIPVNVALNDALMYGKWGLPPLGLAGIGLSSALVFWGSFGLVALCLARLPQWQPWQLFRYQGQIVLSMIREIVVLGWPLCLDYGTEFSALTAAAVLMGQWSTELLAAHNIVMTTTELLLMISWGVSYAAAMRTAHKLGAAQPRAARQVSQISLILNIGLVAVFVVLLWIFPDTIARLYLAPDLENQATLKAAIALFRIGVFFQIAQGFRLISLGILQGLQDTHVLATVDFFAHWVIGIGGGYLLGEYLELRGVGLWCSLTLGQIIAAVVLTLRVQQLLRQRIQALS